MLPFNFNHSPFTAQFRFDQNVPDSNIQHTVLRTDDALVMAEELQVKYLTTDTYCRSGQCNYALSQSRGQRGQAHKIKQHNKNTYNSLVTPKTTRTTQ
jgi:hypothetical protein